MERRNNNKRITGQTTRVELKTRPRLPEWFKVKAPGGENYIHLQNLLKELVSIRDLHTVLETLSDVSTITKDPDLLTEHVRQNLSRQITRQYQTPDGVLPLITMNQDL